MPPSVAVPTSYTCAMPGCVSRAEHVRFRGGETDRAHPGSAASASILSATVRSGSRWCASYTMPIAPAPEDTEDLVAADRLRMRLRRRCPDEPESSEMLEPLAHEHRRVRMAREHLVDGVGALALVELEADRDQVLDLGAVRGALHAVDPTGSTEIGSPGTPSESLARGTIVGRPRRSRDGRGRRDVLRSAPAQRVAITHATRLARATGGTSPRTTDHARPIDGRIAAAERQTAPGHASSPETLHQPARLVTTYA